MSSHGDHEVMFAGEPAYLDGYVPSSWDSPHTSLTTSSLWVGVGLILVSLAGFGAFVYGFAAGSDTTSPMADQGNVIGIVGLIAGFVVLFAGFYSVHHARRHYRAYKKATGRVQ
jgi:sterol desaturase/sphingolipid hydroxylase (fatty acid hydroxylase superfamily)